MDRDRINRDLRLRRANGASMAIFYAVIVVTMLLSALSIVQ